VPAPVPRSPTQGPASEPTSSSSRSSPPATNVDLAHPDVAPNAAATATTWADLAGTWASDPTYWTKLNEIYTDMLTGVGMGEPLAGTGPPCPPESPDIPPGTDVEASLTNVRGITVHTSIAAQLDAMIAAAAGDGVQLSGSGYRSHERQIELRRLHCGTSDYAIYEMPSSQCSPPTARPGSSMHEQGLAVDFRQLLVPHDPLLAVAERQRLRLRLLQPALRTLALVRGRLLSCRGC
jgi:hypothetical protein